jgi:hypothetical protein
MARTSSAFAILAAACALTLGACSKQADTNPTAPGHPGTGSAAEVVRPAMPDSPPGGPSGIAGSAPHTGSSGGDAPAGVTGSGTAGAIQNTIPGQGLDGGIADKAATAASGPGATGTGAAMGAGRSPSLDGSANTTPGNAVGTR